jgi:hypothetical protein
MRSWSTDAGDVRNDPVIAAELADWLRSQGVKDTISYDRIIGAPTRRESTIRSSVPVHSAFWAAIDRFTHEPIPTPVANMSPEQVLIELGKDRSTHPLEALGSADAHRGVLVQPLLEVLERCVNHPTPPPKRGHKKCCGG